MAARSVRNSPVRGTQLLRVLGIASILTLAAASNARASAIALQEVLFNVNGTVYNDTSVPGLDAAAFDAVTGIGALTFTFNPGVAGSYFVDAYFDHEVHSPFFDEFGAAVGSPSAGTSWQIDEPGFGDSNRVGTIYTNVLNHSLDNTNHIPGQSSNELFECGANGGGAPDPTCNNDVAMALGYSFLLGANQHAVITWLLSDSQPAGGFYLHQVGPGANGPDNLYFSSTLSIQAGSPPDPTPVPEPTSLLLLGSGLAIAARRAQARREVTR